MSKKNTYLTLMIICVVVMLLTPILMLYYDHADYVLWIFAGIGIAMAKLYQDARRQEKK